MDKQSVVKHSTLFFLMGMIYFTMEGFWRGWTNISMLFIGGFCAVLIGLINEYPRYCKLKIYKQSFIGTLIILAVEFLSGMLLNIMLKLGLWDYSNVFGNILGQICLPYALLWFALVPFCIWLDDFLRFKLYGEGDPYSLKEIYWELLTAQ